MTFVADSAHGLSLGDLVLVSNGQGATYTDAASGETYTFTVLNENTTWGNFEAVTTVLQSMRTAGSQIEFVRDDNRAPTIGVMVEASGPNALEAAEVVLNAATGKPAELRWQPPSSNAAVTVFDVVWSKLDHQMDSVGERWLRRTYTIALQALPYARSATKTTTPAIVGTAPTVVDSGAATTNWTALLASTSPGPSISVVSGAVTSTYNPATNDAGYYGTRLRRAFPVALNVSVDKYISIDWKASIPSVQALIPTGVGNLTEVRRGPGAVAGFTRSWYRVPDSVASMTSFDFAIIHPAGTGSATLSIDLVQKANSLPVSGTAMQKLASVLPGGSVPTEGTIKVEHATAGLGPTVVFSYKTQGGYAPPLRPWQTLSDPVTANVEAVSGFSNLITNVTEYRVPVSAIPEGDVQLWARLGCDAVATVSVFWGGDSWMGGTLVGDFQGGSTSVTWTTANSWVLVPLATLTLPIAQIGPSGYHRIGLQRQSGVTPNVYVDETYLFAMDDGCLTVIDCGTGTPASGGVANRLRISAPSLDDPAGSIMVATAADFSDAYAPATAKVPCEQTEHQFDPAGTNIFTVTAGTTDAAVSHEGYRRWHTHAGS